MTLGTAGRGDARRHDPAGRHAADALPRPRQPLRRRVHRLARDEPRRGADRRAMRSSSAATAFRFSPDTGRTAEERIVLGIRPEASRTPRSPIASLPQLDAAIAVVEDLGSDAHVIFPVDARANRGRGSAARPTRRRALIGGEGLCLHRPGRRARPLPGRRAASPRPSTRRASTGSTRTPARSLRRTRRLRLRTSSFSASSSASPGAPRVA